MIGMPSPDRERMDALSEAIAGVLRRMEGLERRLDRVETAVRIPAPRPVEPAPLTPAPPVPVIIAEPPAPEPTAPPVSGIPQPPESDLPRSFETRMRLTWVNRIGVVTLVLGVAFFFKYAADNHWIGETGRVLLGAGAGLAALVVADRLWRRGQATFSQGVSGAGIAILYVSYYAAFSLYRILPYAAAFALMALNTAGAAALSLRYASPAMAALGLAGGYLTPLVLTTGANLPWAFFGYIFVLDAGAVLLSRLRRWRFLEVFSFAATALLYFVWVGQAFAPEHRPAAVVYALAFYALFATRNMQGLAICTQFFAAISLLAVCHGKPLDFLPVMLGVTVAGLAVADVRGWSMLPPAALAAFWLLYGIGHEGFQTAAAPQTIAGLLLPVFLVFLAWVPWRVLGRGLEARGGDLVLLALNGPSFFAACYALLDSAHHEWMGTLAVVMALIQIGAAAAIRRSVRADWRAAQLSLGIALGFLVLAAPIQFSGFRITIAWALEGAAMAWIASRIAKPHLLLASFAVLFLVLIRLLAVDAFLYSRPGTHALLWNLRLFTFVAGAVAMCLAANWSRPARSAVGPYIAGHVVLLWGLGIEVLDWAVRTAPLADLSSIESASMSILLAAYAVLLVALGVARRSVLDRVLGLGLIAVVVAKLYLYDVWLIGRMYRVAAFGALGIFLLATSYLYSRFRETIESWWRDRPDNIRDDD
jgi:hypothetical protein